MPCTFTKEGVGRPAGGVFRFGWGAEASLGTALGLFVCGFPLAVDEDYIAL